MDRKHFFDTVRAKPFGGALHQPQVDGMNFILDEWERRSIDKDMRWLAYMLATTFWETGKAMQPVEEGGRGAGSAYGMPDPDTGLIYYGRGFVQLTWKKNYEVMERALGFPLVDHPEKALEPPIAADIMFYGMQHGSFTGVGLGSYFNQVKDDPYNARRIINGVDRAGEIAEFHKQFLLAVH